MPVLRVKTPLALLLVALLAGCASSPTPSAPAPPTNAGAVVDQAPLPYVDPAYDVSWAKLVTYVSHDAVDDSPHHVTATIYVPKAKPPADGFPVVVFDRPVPGTGRGCSPLPGADSDSSPTVVALLRAGYVVAVPDYLGLGRPANGDKRSHPFLDSATVAENTIDTVRATRSAVPRTSTRWVAMGSGAGRPGSLGFQRSRRQLRRRA